MPALAAGVSLDGRHETAAVGCSADTRFRVASVTKPFTGTLALRLLDFDAATGVWPADVRVRPAGVDANSGVEDASGRKDPARMREFVARATAALRRNGTAT